MIRTFARQKTLRTGSTYQQLSEVDRVKLILIKPADQRYSMERDILYKYFSQINFFKELKLPEKDLKRIFSRLHF